MKKMMLVASFGICISSLLLCRKLVNISKKTIEDKEKKYRKFKSYYDILDQWLELRKEKVNFGEYFSQSGVETIAIYGMGKMGIHLVDELEESGIEIAYAIDKELYAEKVKNIVIKSLDEELPPVDLVVVTPIFAYDKIKAQIESKFSCPIVSIENIIYSV